jgi:hypothetical protein
MQGFILALVILEMRGCLKDYFPRLAQTAIFLISASQVARITGS